MCERLLLCCVDVWLYLRLKTARLLGVRLQLEQIVVLLLVPLHRAGDASRLRRRHRDQLDGVATATVMVIVAAARRTVAMVALVLLRLVAVLVLVLRGCRRLVMVVLVVVLRLVLVGRRGRRRRRRGGHVKATRCVRLVGRRRRQRRVETVLNNIDDVLTCETHF